MASEISEIAPSKAKIDQISVDDVAEYILAKCGSMSAMKLQKLVYYCQAWSLVWDDKPLFDEEIQAWMNGPVVPALFAKHRNQFTVSAKTFGGDPAKITADAKETIDAVLAFYADKSAQWLSDLTHKEAPWNDARQGIDAMANSENEITHASMVDYYTRVAEIANAENLQ